MLKVAQPHKVTSSRKRHPGLLLLLGVGTSRGTPWIPASPRGTAGTDVGATRLPQPPVSTRSARGGDRRSEAKGLVDSLALTAHAPKGAASRPLHPHPPQPGTTTHDPQPRAASSQGLSCPSCTVPAWRDQAYLVPFHLSGSGEEKRYHQASNDLRNYGQVNE